MALEPEVRVLVDKRSIGFSAAHFSILESGSEPLHGHNWLVSVHARGRLREDGTLIDFGILKAAMRAECALLDHRMLVPTAAPEVTRHRARRRRGRAPRGLPPLRPPRRRDLPAAGAQHHLRVPRRSSSSSGCGRASARRRSASR